MTTDFSRELSVSFKVMVTVPALTAVTSPSEDTVATDTSEEAQVACLLVALSGVN